MTTDWVTSALWRRRVLFIAVFAVSVAGVVIGTYSLPKKYQATATLYVGSEQVNEAAAFNTTLGEQLTRTYTTLAANPNVADAVLPRLSDDLSRTELLDRMSFTPVERTQLLEITAEDESPEDAAAIANLYATTFVERVEEQLADERTQTRAVINEEASVPTDPTKPNPPLYIGFGVILSLIVAAGLALLRDRLDRTLRVAEDETEVFGHPVLARVPRIRGPMPTHDMADALRRLKTNMDLLDDRPTGVISVTSPQPQEGKTTLAAHLAWACALDGERAVLIEADLRRPGVARTFAGSHLRTNDPGLTAYLAAVEPQNIAIPHPNISRLWVIGAGRPAPNPGALLASGRLGALLQSLTEEYDRVIIDTPPVSVGADASLIASQIDGVVCVLDLLKTSPGQARAGLHQLETVKARILGVVLNNAPRSPGEGYYYRPPLGAASHDEPGGRDEGVAHPA